VQNSAERCTTRCKQRINESDSEAILHANLATTRLVHCSSAIFNGFGKLSAISATALVATSGALAAGEPESEAGGEAALKLPDLSSVNFVGGINGHKLLLWGIFICIFGLAVRPA
jgi:hypothetical protein